MTEEERARWRKLAKTKRQQREQDFLAAYGLLGAAVLRTLVRHDPAGIIGAGAPSVQYTTEARPISERLCRAESRADVRSVIREVLEHYFWPGITDSATEEQMAGEIWETCREHR